MGSRLSKSSKSIRIGFALLTDQSEKHSKASLCGVSMSSRDFSSIVAPFPLSVVDNVDSTYRITRSGCRFDICRLSRNKGKLRLDFYVNFDPILGQVVLSHILVHLLVHDTSLVSQFPIQTYLDLSASSIPNIKVEDPFYVSTVDAPYTDFTPSLSLIRTAGFGLFFDRLCVVCCFTRCVTVSAFVQDPPDGPLVLA